MQFRSKRTCACARLTMKDVAWRQVEEYIAHQKEVKESEDQKQNTKGEINL